MSYIVPADLPKHCNKCPFGMLTFSLPLTKRQHGYVCNVEFTIKGKYEHTIIGDIDENLPRPEWCYLREEMER